MKLRLLRMENLRPHQTAAGECFALTFSGPARAALEQDTYTVKHGGMGEFPLFVTVLGAGANSEALYGAIIHRH